MDGKVEREAPRHWLTGAIGGAWKLVKLGLQRPAVDEAELAAIVTPHLAILVHKRVKYRDGDTICARWRSELHQFVARTLLPQLSEDPALHGVSAEALADRVDAIVAEEQRRAEMAAAVLPVTARFEGAGWAS